MGEDRPLEFRAGLAAMLLSAAVVIAGCGKATVAEPVDAVTSGPQNAVATDHPEPSPVVFEHDAGAVVAGATVSHSFTFTNPSADELVVERDEDIGRNCGCTKLLLSSRHLLPGETATVDVSVDTTAQIGPIQKGGSILWTAARGSRHTARYIIKCDVTMAFELEPESLSFGADDVLQGAVRAVHLRSSLPIDWMSIAAASTSTAFEVVSCSGDSGGGGVCRVKCVALADVEGEQALAKISAKLQTSSGKAPQSTSSVLPLFFRRVIGLESHPRLAAVRVGSDGIGKTKLLLSGPKLASQPISSVAAEGFEVEWQWAPARSDAGFLTARLRVQSRADAPPPRRGDLAVTCGPGEPLLVPFRIVK